jgi:hypothetical protein
VDPCPYCEGETQNAPNHGGRSADGQQFGRAALVHCKDCDRFIGRATDGQLVEMVEVWDA